MLVGVANAIDIALVGGDGEVACGLAGVPLPLAAVLAAVAKLRQQLDDRSLGHTCVVVGLEGVDQSSQLVMAERVVAHHHLGSEQRGHFLCRGLVVAVVHQHRVAQVVVASTCGSLSTAIGSVLDEVGVGHLRIGHVLAKHALVMPNDRSPIGANLVAKGRTGHCPASVVGVINATAAILIVGPGQTFDVLRLCGNKLYAGGQAVVHEREQVVALVPSHVGDVDSQAGGHRGVADVAATLLHLSDRSVRRGLQVGWSVGNGHHEIAHELGQTIIQNGIGRAGIGERSHLVVLHIAQALVIDEHVVAQHTDRHDTQGVAQSPVAPIVPRGLPPFPNVLPSAIAATKEAHGRGVPHLQHPLAELLEALGRPTFIVAQELGGLRKLVAVEACSEGVVGVATDALGGVGPLHEHIDGMAGIGLVARYFPNEGVLVGYCGTAGCVDVVLSLTATAHNGLHGRCASGRLCVGGLGQHFDGGRDGGVALGQ